MRQSNLRERLAAIKRLAIIVVICWTIVVSGSLAWNYIHERRQAFELAEKEALITFNKDQAFRHWVSKHGGVYVPATEETPPNAYLAHLPDRDVTLPSGKKLTLMNPAYALRQLMHDFEQDYDTRGHITSLNPLNPANAPDAWEHRSLQAFERGVTETSELAEVNNKTFLRLIRPMIMKTECLKCHGRQGYKVGEIRGGVGVAIPIAPYLQMQRSFTAGLLATHGVIWLLGVGGIGFVYTRGRQNVIELTESAERIIENEERIRTLSNNIPNGLIYQMTLDASGRKKFVYVSDGVERLHGVTPDAVLRDPMKLYGQIVEEDRAMMEAAEARANLDRSLFSMDMRIRRPDNELRWIHLSSSPRTLPDGGTVWDGLEIDVTDHKQAEENLRRTNELLERVFSVSHTLIAYLDTDFNFIRVNEAYAAADGREPGYFTGKNHFDLFPNADNEEIFRSVVRTGDPSVVLEKPFEYAHHPERGVSYWDWTLQAVKKSDGSVEGLVLTLQNVSERKQAALEKQKLEQQLRQAQKMESIGTLAGGVAHDFNNILTAILGYGSMLRKKMKSDDPLQAMVDPILSSAERAARLTHSLLAFSRKQVFDSKPVELNSVVRGIDKLLRRLISEDVSLVTRLAERDLVAVADAGQIEQVLMNLATNARDAMPKGGTLTITSQEAELNEEFMKMHGFGKAGRYALITVSDTGAGMDARTMDKIFEPFFTTKELGRGTGLGLSIVYGIVKQHNGTITVYSEPGNGATFKLYLPLVADAAKDARTEYHAPPRGGAETILLAEDDKTVRTLIKTVLEDAGYRVIEAADGKEACDLFRELKTRVELLITDVVMPRMSGKELYDEARAIKADARVIFMSGYTADIIQTKGIVEAGLAFISKPVNPSDLLRKVREVLDKKR